VTSALGPRAWSPSENIDRESPWGFSQVVSLLVA